MKHYFQLICLSGSLLLFSCGEKNDLSSEEVIEQKDSIPAVEKIEQNNVINEKLELTEVEENIFREYYPGKVHVKFEGPQDDKGERHGKWIYFSEEGTELSMTMYMHGKKHGHSIVKYPNGAIHYVGEYQNDKPVGVWKTYAVNGELTKEKDYGYPDDTAEN